MVLFSWILNLIQDFTLILTLNTWWGTALFHIRSLVCKQQLHATEQAHKATCSEPEGKNTSISWGQGLLPSCGYC